MMPRVLVIDDDVGVRKVASTFLALAGYEVETAKDGEDAITRYRFSDFALVVTDLGMPNIDGFTILSVIRERYLGVKVILMSGKPHLLKDTSADETLEKPFTQERFLEKVRLVCPQKKE